MTRALRRPVRSIASSYATVHCEAERVVRPVKTAVGHGTRAQRSNRPPATTLRFPTAKASRSGISTRTSSQKILAPPVLDEGDGPPGVAHLRRRPVSSDAGVGPGAEVSTSVAIPHRGQRPGVDAPEEEVGVERDRELRLDTWSAGVGPGPSSIRSSSSATEPFALSSIMCTYWLSIPRRYTLVFPMHQTSQSSSRAAARRLEQVRVLDPDGVGVEAAPCWRPAAA